MNRNLNDHSAEFLKRQAKKLKKKLGITHHQALDKVAVAVGFSNWAHFCNSAQKSTPLAAFNIQTNVSHDNELAPGTLVRLKQRRGVVGLVYKSDGRAVSFYHDWGPMFAAREEVAVCRNQTPAGTFRPLRLYLPYGKWTCRDGIEVLFNRDYSPLWAKAPDGAVDSVDPKAWVDWVDQDHFFNDGNSPLYDKKTLSRCLAVLSAWGVQNRLNRLVAMLPLAIRTGNVDILKGARGVDANFLAPSNRPGFPK